MKFTPEERLRRRQESVEKHEAKKRLARVLVGGYVYPVSEKRCSQCRDTKSFRAFSVKPASRDGLHGVCRACNVISAKKSAALSPEKVKGHKAGWKERNPEKVKEQGRIDKRRAYAKDPRKILAKVHGQYRKHREKRLATMASPEGRARRRFNQQRRMARIAQAENTLTRAEWDLVFEAYGGRCAYCSAEATDIDHLLAVARGGGFSKDNVIPACGDCNGAKNARLFHRFCESRGLDVQAVLARHPFRIFVQAYAPSKTW